MNTQGNAHNIYPILIVLRAPLFSKLFPLYVIGELCYVNLRNFSLLDLKLATQEDRPK